VNLQFDPSDLTRWHQDLLRYGHRLTADPDLCEDLAQEAILRLLRLQPQARPDNPRAWLFRVLTNLVRDGARTFERVQRKHLRLVPDEPSTPSLDYERTETVARVRAVLDRLSPRDQEMLILRESGFQHREIAAIVGVKPQSVSVLLARAMERFKAAYSAEATV
jgi:RNA polymerase sigma-70 factor (ECF subfamily)